MTSLALSVSVLVLMVPHLPFAKELKTENRGFMTTETLLLVLLLLLFMVLVLLVESSLRQIVLDQLNSSMLLFIYCV